MCEPVVWVAPVNGLEPHTPPILDLCEQLQDIVSDARLDIIAGKAIVELNH
jgi:hypothetical protein